MTRGGAWALGLAGCQGFWLASSWLLKLKRRGFEAPLKRQKWLRNLLVNTSKWPHFTFSSGDKSHLHYYKDLVPHLYAKSGELNPTTRWDRCTEFFGLGAVPWQACYSSVSLLCTLLSVLKPSQAIGNKRWQRRATVLASTPKLEARNGHNTNLDIGVEISFMKMIK